VAAKQWSLPKSRQSEAREALRPNIPQGFTDFERNDSMAKKPGPAKPAAPPTLASLKAQATAAANLNAQKTSKAKSGHGRLPHGKDAKGKSQHHDAAKSAQEVWGMIYTQTLNRLKNKWKYK
jgi:hypothetical protein